ncbi:MAG: hypothetical protein ACI89U_002154 [Gammaproteobacteria bacterium]|jgi:hypothetical protein
MKIRMLRILSFAGLMIAAANVSAGWIWVTDPDNTDDAVNPGPANVAPAGPDSQSEANVEIWLADLLLDMSTDDLTLLGSGDATPDAFSGLDVLGADYIVLHYGNYPGDEFGNVNIAFSCDTGCDTFNPVNQGLSNYRIFGSALEVPEPSTLALLGLGLAGLSFTRRRAKG